MRHRFMSLGVVLLFSSSAWAQAPSAAARCAALGTFQYGGGTLAITKTEWLAAGSKPPASGPMPPLAVSLPAYCRVDGVLDRREGAQGKPYGIGFALALPENWNGRFLMQGGGGLNGTVGFPLGPVAAGDSPALARGFAVVSTDTGHQGAVFDSSFMQDQQAALDFAYVAVGRIAGLAKQMVAGYYGKPADRSYFTGCSTGGREGMVMAQRYPSYFDGIVSGAPAMRTGHSNLALMSMVTAFNEIAPRDPAGKPISGGAFSNGDRKLIADALLDSCDARDGVKDGMIFDTSGCRFDPSTLVCKGAKAEGCLSPQQAAAMAKAFAGPKDSKGNQIYPRYLYDVGITASGRGIPGILSPGAGPPVPIAGAGLDIDAQARLVETSPLQLQTDTAAWTNLNAFSSRGGKLIFYHGVSDPWFSAMDTVEYYDRLGKTNGSPEQVLTWSRLFLQPGMGHCGGGQGALDRFDLLSAVVDWVEKGTAPDAITSTSRSSSRSRPLCAYPRYAHYKGSGDSEDAVNFECRDSSR